MFVYTGQGIYEQLGNSPHVLQTKANIEANPELTARIQHKGLRVTELGK